MKPAIPVNNMYIVLKILLFRVPDRRMQATIASSIFIPNAYTPVQMICGEMKSFSGF